MAARWEYYVYELIDPRSGLPFYIGKGKGNRIHQHEREANRGEKGPKADLIRDIHTAGFAVSAKVVRQFTDEVAAFAYEKKLIARYGFDNLTNRTAGGGGVRLHDIKPNSPAYWRETMKLFAAVIRRSGYFSKPIKITILGETIEWGWDFFENIKHMMWQSFSAYGRNEALDFYNGLGVNFIPPLLAENNTENNGI